MIAASASLREELAACAELRIPHSQFLGGTPVWDELDRNKFLAWRRWLDLHCKRCGTMEQEWRADPDAYTYQLEHCEGCKRMADGQESIPEKGGAGFNVILIPPRFARIEG